MEPLLRYCTVSYQNMERGQRIQNAVVIGHKMKKIFQKEAGFIIVAHQYFCDCDAPIVIYALERWFIITT